MAITAIQKCGREMNRRRHDAQHPVRPLVVKEPCSHPTRYGKKDHNENGKDDQTGGDGNPCPELLLHGGSRIKRDSQVETGSIPQPLHVPYGERLVQAELSPEGLNLLLAQCLLVAEGGANRITGNNLQQEEEQGEGDPQNRDEPEQPL